MKAIVHIGTQKTGTTTLQAFLALNRAALSSQGFRVQPMNPRIPSAMELALAGVLGAGGVLESRAKRWDMGLRGRESQQRHLARYEAMLAQGRETWPEHTFVASSEQIHAWLHNRDRIEALHRMLTRHFTSVRYVVYYRPQDEFTLSTWSEALRRGELHDLDSHIARGLGVNYGRRARIWASVVGREALCVRLFQRSTLVNGDLLDDFCTLAGIDRAPLETPPNLNAALSAEEAALYLRLGRHMAPRLRGGMPNPLFRLARRWLARGLARPGTPLSLTADQRAQILRAHAEGNAMLREDFFPDRATLFDPPG